MIWYQKAAEQGNVYGQYNMGRFYDLGQGVPQNRALAIEWYQKAAAQGHGAARERLAELGVK